MPRCGVTDSQNQFLCEGLDIKLISSQYPAHRTQIVHLPGLCVSCI